MNDEFNKKTIENWLNREFFGQIEADGYVQDAKGRMVRKTGRNHTDFGLTIRFNAYRRFGEYYLEPDAEIRWRKFEDLFHAFDLVNFKPSKYAKKPERHPVFLIKNFNYIRHEIEKKHRPTRYLAGPADLPDALAETVDDYRRCIRDWLDAWLDWESALQLLERDEELCGAWREIAYFCLLEQVRGRQAACAKAEEWTGLELSQFSTAQVAYLRGTLCAPA